MFNSARLCRVSNDNLTSNLSGWIEEMEADVVHLTSSVISLLECKRTITLKYMVTCGEPVTRAVIQDWSSKVVLINLYGKLNGTILKPL
jgi:non-ribosomal peptide synthetase component F